MANHAVTILGLPSSGKTTFLAALWHLVTSPDGVDTALRFQNLKHGDASHLNTIARLWRYAKTQERTEVGSNRIVSMNLVDRNENSVQLSFPDVSGETFRRIWEDRDCTQSVAEILMEGSGLLLFAHADKIEKPQWVIDNAALTRKLGLTVENGEETPWHPSLAPTQVQLVDLLQLLRLPPLKVTPKKLVIVLSAWDLVAIEERTPENFLIEKLPLLDQYLRAQSDGWEWRVYGVSAQGGDYTTEAEALRDQDYPSKRIKLTDGVRLSHDLTEPIEWLME